MKEGQAGIIEVLKYAIQMELDGKKFYQLAAKESNNKAGKELFPWLAEQEDEHRKRFERIYEALAADKGWPEIDVKPDKNKKLVTLFARAIKKAGTAVKAGHGEFEAVEKAMEMEIKSRDYYRLHADKSVSDIAKNFYSQIAAEEQGHYLALVDYKEYIADPVGWFTRTEHHMLDGA
ncbi:MAG: ferritin family protein [Dehalococcoidia bacterium]|nr:ferritin family protein [Dehalococcoidia bacterium]MDD5494873.1 ferritin family protein [Dehalococcoidia bacterium]